ncbi:hypothetical protein H6F50_22260 [Coleofasciculus sp. FACHB-712]|uniref:hypothetical protein n=1 Tax=Coleofasciculus sp. FACHB-712 TaxID=2692789 RepID=UPI001687D426|nr:hypothetical protein [Coleofasciculus sp. FACHB-712]MBD1945043.1 hypothetical protein [Coleofasciculus sp. FACHB-712]
MRFRLFQGDLCIHGSRKRRGESEPQVEAGWGSGEWVIAEFDIKVHLLSLN